VSHATLAFSELFIYTFSMYNYKSFATCFLNKKDKKSAVSR